MRTQKIRRLGWDKRTAKRVIVVGEVAGHKLFVGVKNRPLSSKEINLLGGRLFGLCRKHRIDAGKLGLSLCELGSNIYYRTCP